LARVLQMSLGRSSSPRVTFTTVLVIPDKLCHTGDWDRMASASMKSKPDYLCGTRYSMQRLLCTGCNQNLCSARKVGRLETVHVVSHWERRGEGVAGRSRPLRTGSQGQVRCLVHMGNSLAWPDACRLTLPRNHISGPRLGNTQPTGARVEPSLKFEGVGDLIGEA